MKVSVGQILEGAFGLIRDHYQAVALWAGISFAVNVALLLTIGPAMGGLASLSQGAGGAAFAQSILPMFAVGLLSSLISVVLYTAAMRAVLRPEASGIGYLRVGMDELRMLLLLILFGFAGFILALGIFLIFGLFGAGVAMSGNPTALSILVMMFAGFGAFLLYLFLVLRFSLAFPLTLYRQQITIGEAWALSRGRFWTLFGAALVVTLIGMVMSGASSVFGAGSYLADLSPAASDPDSVSQALTGGLLQPAMFVQMFVSAIVSAVWIALSGGSAATAAKLLLADEFDDVEQVFG